MEQEQAQNQQAKSLKAKAAEAREDRLKEALRANLKRRKAQGRARVVDDTSEKDEG